MDFYRQQFSTPAGTLITEITGRMLSSRSNAQICSNGQRLPRPDGNDFMPSAPDSVNQLIQRPIDERAQQSVLAT